MPSRPVIGLLAAAALAFSLAACTGEPAPAPSASAGADAGAGDICSAASGTSSDAIEATGGFDEAPTVTVPGDLDPATTERTVLIEGGGSDELIAGTTAKVAVTFLNGTTGEQIEQFGYVDGQQPFEFPMDTASLPGITKALGCLTEGTRVAAVIPAAEAFGAEGNPQLGLGAGESLVAVLDVVGVGQPLPDVSEVPQAADGEPQDPTPGFPTVTLSDSGEPTVDVSGVAAPTELQVAVLKKGSGAVVPEGAQVIVQYKGVLLADGTEFDSSWSRGEPAQFGLSGVVPGFAQAIAGQTVGSQVIAVIPSALAYGDQTAGSIPPNSDLVFVIDILAAS